MASTQPQDPKLTRQIAIWDPALPFPDSEWMGEPSPITHVTVERAEQGRYHYLHESA